MASTVPQAARIPWALRSDIEIHPAEDGGDQWTLRDPVKLNYFRIGSDELAFLQSLNGASSLQDSVETLNKKYSRTSFSAVNLQHFLVNALKAGLLTPVRISYGRHLATDARRHRTTAFSRKMLSLVSHRFRGIDPTPLLRVADRSLGWLFHPSLLRLATAFVVAVFALLIARWPQLQAELPSLQELVRPQNLLILALTVTCIKVLHELGHGLTCHHYGGECHEIGVLLIGFLPLLYCDVSDSWLQQHRSRRMQVAAAGIAVELILAAAFGLLWIASVPGTLHSFFLNVTLICSINTLLINGNPLLKYDGYYVLSDWIRIPNLAAESRQAAFAIFDRVVLGHSIVPTSSSTSFWRSLWLPVFGASSVAYRLFMIIAILVIMHSSLKEYGFESLSIVFALSVVAGILFSVRGFVRQRQALVYQNGEWSMRAIVGISCAIMGLAILGFWPLPYSVEAPFTLTPGNSSPVFVSTPGHSKAKLLEGGEVATGQIIFTLSNPELELIKSQAESDVALSRIRLANLMSNRTAAQSSSSAIPAARQAVDNAELRFARLNERLDRLNLTSPAAGKVLPARRRGRKEESKFALRSWEGSLLDSENESVWAEEQTLACWVGSSSMYRAVLYVSQHDIDFVREEANVQLTYNSMPGSPAHGQVKRISNTPEFTAPQELTATGVLLTDSSNGRLAEVLYAAHVQSLETSELPPLYSTGYARIECKPMSLATRTWRLISRTFAFEL